MKKIVLFFLAIFLISNSILAMSEGPFKVQYLNLEQPTSELLKDIGRTEDGVPTLFGHLQLQTQIQQTEQKRQVRLYNWTGRDILITVTAAPEEGTETILMENYRLKKNKSITFPAQTVMITMEKNNKRARKPKKYNPFFAYQINFEGGLYFILDDAQKPLAQVENF